MNRKIQNRLDDKTKNAIDAIWGKMDTDLGKAAHRAMANTKNHRNPYKTDHGKVLKEKYPIHINRVDIALAYLFQDGNCFYTGLPIDLQATFQTAERDEQYPPYGLSMNRFNPDLDFTVANTVASIQCVYPLKRTIDGSKFNGTLIIDQLPKPDFNPLKTMGMFNANLRSFITFLYSNFGHINQVDKLTTELRSLIRKP